MSLIPGTRLGVYEVTARLGAGGMGEVYRATDTRLKRDVALKILPAAVAADAERLARFRREAELLAALNHPNIASVHGLEESGPTTALVMELVEGDDLAQRLAYGALPLADVLDVARQIAVALEAAHEQGIVHRDLKPANIKVRPDGVVKVLDFGLAKSLASSTVAEATITALSSPGSILGTPAYMSPEQARGETTGREADIWAFGVVCYEMLTGLSPFSRPTTADTLVQVLTASLDEARLPDATPPALRRLIRRCLERDPRRRLRHIGDARIEIEDIAAGAGAEPGTRSIQGPAGLPRRRVLRDAAAAVGLLVAGAAGGMWVQGRWRPSPLPAYRRLTFRRGLIRSARVAPDGQTILYGALWDGEPCRVHTVRVDGPESRPLDLPAANVLAVSRSGELALALGPHELGIITYGTLARVPIAGGAPRPMVEAVKFADWSPDGAELAIVRLVDGGDQLEYPVGTPLVTPAPDQPSGLGFVRVSPDGRSVAYVQYRSPGSLIGRLMVTDRSGRATAVTPEYVNIHGLAWRGSDLVFTAADEGPLFRALRVVTPGREPRILARLPGNTTIWDVLPDGRLITAQTDDRGVMIVRRRGDAGEHDLSWLDASQLEDLSHDGQQLLFTEYGQGGGPAFGAYLRSVDGSAAVRLGAGRAVALSPDGRWAVCMSSAPPSPHLDVLPTGAGEPRRLENTGLAFFGARWMPDGKRLAVAAREPGRQTRVFVLDPASGQSNPITPEGVESWVLSPEGSMVAARIGSGIRVYPTAGGASSDVPGVAGHETTVGWIDSGLLVIRPGDPSSPLGQIYRVDLKTGRQEAWRNILPRDRAGIMGLTAFRAAPDGQSYAYAWHRALSNLYLADAIG